MAAPVITIKDLSKIYGYGESTTTALQDVSLTIEKGEFVAIMGPSGSGKSTLMNILGLLDTTSEGTYELDGVSVANFNQRKRAKIRRTKIGFVFQSFNLLGKLNVLDNVSLPLMYAGKSQLKRAHAASRLLKTFSLQEREYFMPSQLSGGQLQRVAIARALVNRPAIILADEPTGNLDSKASEIIMHELREVHKRGNTIIMVTHNKDLCVYADRVIHMMDGRIDRDSKVPKKKGKK
jgi:putative ABC transport system ATP-binding protein